MGGSDGKMADVLAVDAPFLDVEEIDIHVHVYRPSTRETLTSFVAGTGGKLFLLPCASRTALGYVIPRSGSLSLSRHVVIYYPIVDSS
jgi:hypothetical protein